MEPGKDKSTRTLSASGREAFGHALIQCLLAALGVPDGARRRNGKDQEDHNANSNQESQHVAPLSWNLGQVASP